MVDYVRELIVNKSCKCSKYGSFEHSLFFFCWLFLSLKHASTITALQTDLYFTMTSPTTGFIKIAKKRSDETFIQPLSAPVDNIIIISVKDVYSSCPNGLEVYTQDKNSSRVSLLKRCEHRYTDIFILNTNNVTLQWKKLPGVCYGLYRKYHNPVCSATYFSFQPRNKAPQKLSSGLFNCSVDYYWRFKQHLDCNLKVECEDGRDETEHCPFSSPACHGWVAIRDKCYKYVGMEIFERSVDNKLSPVMKCVSFCSSLNASLATFRTSDDYAALCSVFRERIQNEFLEQKAVIGLSFGSLSVPNIYRGLLVTHGRTVIHHSFRLERKFAIYKGAEQCFSLYFTHKHSHNQLGTYALHPLPCSSHSFFFESYHKQRFKSYAICEVTIDNHNHKYNLISFSNVSFNFRHENVNFSKCPSAQMVHRFLFCYPHNACGQMLTHACTLPSNLDNGFQRTDQLMTSAHVFECADGIGRVSFTLVCDFRQHCGDSSDETFCQHPPCDAFACSNGQCVSYTKRCDMVSHCLDDSDELDCRAYEDISLNIRDMRSPVLISFDGMHTFITKSMSLNETCPETHYRCPGDYNDCLPIYTRCNDWYDCVDHDDEEGCDNMTCPGFYRCFNSTFCVHADNLCDGWPHCPQHDDEWLCNMTCPAQCLCQGHMFLCSKSFSAHLFPHLRFLDAQGSRMTPSELTNNFYIVHLSLSSCSLGILPTMTFFNLQFLDLSANNLTIVSMAAFAGLANLRTLSLAKNPIEFIRRDSNFTVKLSALKKVDLSCSKLTVFDSKAFSNMVNVKHLNLSFSTIHTIHPNGFQHTPKLNELHLTGSPIKWFSGNLFKPLTFLRTLSSQSYKLCCREILPDHFEMISCDAPEDEVSSCEDLLQSGTYRGFLWLISCLSLLGNVFCLVVRVCVQRTASVTGFHVFVTNLSMADLLMGVYMVTIGVADSVFRGQYLFYDETWKHSVACKVAGFFSLLSCEVSALIIWLITLDRFIVLHFLFSSLRFQRMSAAIACLLTWLLGLMLAITPLLPVTSHWEFFSQTGICIPLPVTSRDFEGKSFSISVYIVFNFVMFVLIAAGQAFIYWSVQKNALKIDSTKVSRDLTIARRLMSVAVTDFLCWFPVGLCGLLALAGIPIPDEVNVALAIFVLPLNSALNPFMYTFNTLVEKRRKAKEGLLLQWLESQADYI